MKPIAIAIFFLSSISSTSRWFNEVESKDCDEKLKKNLWNIYSQDDDDDDKKK